MKKLLLVIALIFGMINTLQAESVTKTINEEEAKQKCEKNDAEACLEYGQYLEMVKKNYNEADVAYLKSCDLGNGLGCYQYALGLHFNEKLTKALKMYEKSCNLHVLTACQAHDKLTGKKYRKEKGFWQFACEKNPKSSACDKYKKM